MDRHGQNELTRGRTSIDPYVFNPFEQKESENRDMHHLRLFSAFLTLTPLLFVACGDANPPPNNTSSSGETGGAAGQAGAGGTGGSGGNTGGMGGSNGGAVPTSGADIFPWLQAKEYANFAAESGQHASTGPHGGNVRTFLNPILFDALSSGSTNFPVGTAAVKELWGNGSKLLGWAVFVKTQADSAAGNGFYWYEVYSATDPSNPVADGNGVGLCSGCHSNGTDYFLTPFPLQ